MTNLKVTSKKYNDKDVLEVENLDEAVNEEIEAGKIVIPAGGTKLYRHVLTFYDNDTGSNYTCVFISNSNEEANNVTKIMSLLNTAISIVTFREGDSVNVMGMIFIEETSIKGVKGSGTSYEYNFDMESGYIQNIVDTVTPL